MSHFKRIFAGALLAALMSAPFVAEGQAPGQSARSMIEALNDSKPSQAGVVTCGSVGANFYANLAIAGELVKIGVPASGDIERALDPTNNEWPSSPSARAGYFLGYAYAQINGERAYPFLRSLLNNAGVTDRIRFCDAVAIAFDLTSYIDSELGMLPPGGCRAPQPRDGLNAFIFDWMNRDRARLLSIVGPRARKSLERLLSGTEWQGLGNSLEENRTTVHHVALGYKLQFAGVWGTATGRPVSAGQGIDLSQYSHDPLVEVDFSDASGRHCGKSEVQFRQLKTNTLPRYVVDNSDAGQLIRTISSCATRVDHQP